MRFGNTWIWSDGDQTQAIREQSKVNGWISRAVTGLVLLLVLCGTFMPSGMLRDILLALVVLRLIWSPDEGFRSPIRLSRTGYSLRF